jgi:tetratricopeptide (TPR) repeat protein
MASHAIARDRKPGMRTEIAAAAYARGAFREARAACNAVLRRQPRDTEALRLLALVELRAGRAADALIAIGRAIATAPSDAALQATRGDILRQSGRHAEAVAAYDRALELSPGKPEFHSGRGKALSDDGRHADALSSHEEALRAGGETATRLVNRGIALRRLERFEEALTDAERATKLAPASAAALNLLGTVLQELDRPAQAMLALSKAIALAPRDALGHYHRANLLRKFGQFEGALDDYSRALELAPDVRTARLGRASLLSDFGRFEQADADFALLVSSPHASAEERFNSALSHLRRGSFDAGWRGYDNRWRIAAAATFTLETDKPSWRPGHPSGTLLAWGEQGIGDEIMFGSILPDLVRAEPGTQLGVDERLVPLFSRSFPGIPVWRRGALRELPFDAHVPLGDLGMHFRPTPESFPRTPFLVADPDLAARLRSRLAADGKPVVGISWGSSRKAAASKCIDIARIGNTPALRDARLVNLQYGNCIEDLERLARTGADIIDASEIDKTNDIDGLAALLEACDLVVTISNVTAHLAGALGKPTFLLLGNPADWRWGTCAATSHWYRSVRIIRQARPGDWDGVFATLDAALCSAFPALGQGAPSTRLQHPEPA